MTNEVLEKLICGERCYEILRKKLRDDAIKDFYLVDYEVIPLKEVNGYMGQYFTLKTTISCADSPSVSREYNFFTKIPPPTTSPQYDWILEYGSFKKEIDLYTTVFPAVLKNLEKKSIPECFFSDDDQVIVLEDMTHSGYKMTNKFQCFDLDHCTIFVRTLAKFHAKFIIFEELEKKNIHEEFSHCLRETLWPITEGRAKRMFDAAVKGVLSMVDLLELFDECQRQRFKRILSTLFLGHEKKLLPSDKYRNVICHGDLWANNILFRYDKNDKPEACCLIDFQLARYNPPAHDVLCFLQFTTTRKLREIHGETLFRTYWECMAESLGEAGLEASTVFPWTEFSDSIEELKLMCMIHGILNIPIMLLEPTTAGKYWAEKPELLESVLYTDRTPLICEQFYDVPEYRKRMSDALLELHESTLNFH